MRKRYGRGAPATSSASQVDMTEGVEANLVVLPMDAGALSGARCQTVAWATRSRCCGRSMARRSAVERCADAARVVTIREWAERTCAVRLLG